MADSYTQNDEPLYDQAPGQYLHVTPGAALPLSVDPVLSVTWWFPAMSLCVLVLRQSLTLNPAHPSLHSAIPLSLSHPTQSHDALAHSAHSTHSLLPMIRRR
jgi:hypothetical protein